MSDTVSILDGNTFIVSDKRGDVEATPTDTTGLFQNDTRFLSRWVLTVDGTRPTVLSTDDLAYYKVQFFQAHSTGTVYVDSNLSCVRQRSIGGGFREDITLWNHGKERMEIELKLEAAADFADLFEVKDKLEKKGELYRRVEGKVLLLGYRRQKFHRQTRITAKDASEVREDGFTYKVRLEPHSGWTTVVEVEAVINPDQKGRPTAGKAPSARDPDTVQNVKAWVDAAPTLKSAWNPSSTRTREASSTWLPFDFEPRLPPDPSRRRDFRGSWPCSAATA